MEISKSKKEINIYRKLITCEVVSQAMKSNISVFQSMVTPSNSTMINQVLLYGAGNKDNKKKTGFDNVLCIYYLIMRAKVSIEMCVPSLVSEAMARCLMAASEKGVRVRVAIHRSEDYRHLQALAEQGVEVKVIRAERLEHEFILLDGTSGVAVSGALGDTADRTAAVVSSERPLLDALRAEFRRLWCAVPVQHYRFDISCNPLP